MSEPKKPSLQYKNRTGIPMGSLAGCCSVAAFSRTFAPKVVGAPNEFYLDYATAKLENTEQHLERLREDIECILTHSEYRPVFFTTRSDREAIFEEMLKELPEYFSIATQTPTCHPPPENHTVTVWVCHKHPPGRPISVEEAIAEVKDLNAVGVAHEV